MSVRLVSIFRFMVLAFCLALLGGCAPGTPLLQQLRNENTNKIVVVVEAGPFQYTVPTFADAPYVDSGVATALFGVLGALSVQMRLDQAHVALNTEARARGVMFNHRDAFIELLVQRFRERGVVVEIVSATYGKGFMSSDRGYFQPALAEVQKLPKEFPSFYLNLDFGSCTVGSVTPCIRYSLNSTGVVTSPGPRQKYRGFSSIEPNFYRSAQPSSAIRFTSVEDAITHIAEFDAAFALVAPRAAENLVRELGKETSK